jgi:hypothetical protein
MFVAVEGARAAAGPLGGARNAAGPRGGDLDGPETGSCPVEERCVSFTAGDGVTAAASACAGEPSNVTGERVFADWDCDWESARSEAGRDGMMVVGPRSRGGDCRLNG